MVALDCRFVDATEQAEIDNLERLAVVLFAMETDGQTASGLVGGMVDLWWGQPRSVSQYRQH